MGFHRRLLLLLAAATIFGISLIASAFGVDHSVGRRRRQGFHLRTLKPLVLHDLRDDQDSAPTDADVPARTQRRERKNKYKNFSKVSDQIDPQEALIAESGRKNQEILAEISQAVKKSRPEPEILPLPKVEFPDTKDIDVSITVSINQCTSHHLDRRESHCDVLI